MLFRKQQKIEMMAGLDIGSSMIRLVAGHVAMGDRGDQLGRPTVRVVGAAEVPSDGVQRGVVTSIEELISALSHALEGVERMTGFPVESVWLGVNGPHIMTQESKGIIAVAKTNGEITPDDATRSVDAARAVPLPLNYDIVHVLPRSFSVDGQIGIKDPVGMTGMRLEVDTKIVYGMSTHLKNVTRAVYRAGLDIDDMVLSILAAADTVTTARERELGVAVVNIGAATTSLAVYEEGNTVHIAVLPIGSQHITNDIAVGLRTGIDIAERVKINFGHAIARDISKKDIIDVSLVGGAQDEMASRLYVAQIIEARVVEICEKIYRELAAIGKSGMLPGGVIFTGGGAKVGGLIECAKATLRLPASLGYAVETQSVSNAAGDIAFAPAIGLLKWGAQAGVPTTKRRGAARSAGAVIQKLQRAKEWLMP